MDSLDAPLRLGELETTIQFVETHLCDVKTILEEMGRIWGLALEGNRGEKA
jgi:hypothetical protein